MTQNLPVPRDANPPAPTTYGYVYPLTPPPQQSLTDAASIVTEVLAIFTEAGDRLQRALQRPYPCALCPADMNGLNEWQKRRHFNTHPMADRARVVGWFRAVMGT